MVTARSHVTSRGSILQRIKSDPHSFLAGGFFQESFNFFIQFFAEQYILPLILFTITTFYLAGFSSAILFPERTLTVGTSPTQPYAY